MSSFQKGDWTNCRYDICEIVKDDDVFCTVAADDVDLVISVLEENEQLKQKINEFEKQKAINCNNCQYFVSDCGSSDCLKREDIGYKGTCIDGMDLHLLALGCPYYD